jgi:hypothetical protein
MPGLRQIPNAYGQPGVIGVYNEVAANTWGDAKAGDVGVELDTFMCETFLSPDGADELAELLTRAAARARRHAARIRRTLDRHGESVGALDG